MHCCPMLFSPFIRMVKFCSGCFKQVFFHWAKKMVAGRVRQVVILYSNDYMGICLGRLCIDCLRRVVVLIEMIVWTSIYFLIITLVYYYTTNLVLKNLYLENSSGKLITDSMVSPHYPPDQWGGGLILKSSNHWGL